MQSVQRCATTIQQQYNSNKRSKRSRSNGRSRQDCEAAQVLSELTMPGYTSQYTQTHTLKEGEREGERESQQKRQSQRERERERKRKSDNMACIMKCPNQVTANLTACNTHIAYLYI